MNVYEQILVIFLSTFLAIFLVLGIILLMYGIRIAKSVERISMKAEGLVEKAENVSEFIEHAAAQLTIGRFIGSLAGMFNRKKQSNKGKS